MIAELENGAHNMTYLSKSMTSTAHPHQIWQTLQKCEHGSK